MITLSNRRAPHLASGRIILVILATALLPGLARANPASPILPGLSPDGTYTVEYDIHYYCGYVMSDVRLEERIPGSAYWSPVRDVDYDGLVDFSKTVEGTYRYRLRVYCVDEWGEDEWVEWSNSASVEVDIYSGPPVESSSTEEQLKFTYDVRVGDINSDGLHDIYVARTGGGMALDGSIESTILRNVGNGAFTLISPTSAQISTARSWPSSNIPVLLDDLNADNYLDVVLRYIGNVIPGAQDQIIFAPGQPYSSEPLGIRSIDSDLVSFIADAGAWNLDNDYVEDNTVWIAGGYWYTVWTCRWEYWAGEWSFECYPYAYWADQSYPTYPGLHQDVIDMWHEYQGYMNDSSPYSDIFNIVQAAVGAPLGGSDDCDDPIDPFVPDDVECQAVTISEALAAVRRTLEWLNSEPKMYFGREAGVVYVTTHHAFGLSITPRHLAVEYRDPNTEEAIWVAAYLNTSTGEWLLESAENGPSDDPAKNNRVAIVYHATLPNDLYFQNVLNSRRNYRDCLPYWLFPSQTAATDYNSNGFVAGIVSATNGNPIFTVPQFPNFEHFVGGGIPVPDIEFTEDAPTCP